MSEKNFENPEFTNKGRPTTLTQWAMKPTCFAHINTKISSSVLRNYYLHRKDCLCGPP